MDRPIGESEEGGRERERERMREKRGSALQQCEGQKKIGKKGKPGCTCIRKALGGAYSREGSLGIF